MADYNSGGVKQYLSWKFSSGGGGIIYNGIAYPEGEAGLKALADAVAQDGAFDNVVITQNGFQGGYATGSQAMPRSEFLAIIMELLKEMGFLPTSGARSMMIFGDYSGGMANT